MSELKWPEQPKNWKFIDELKAPRHTKIVWERAKIKKGEADLSKGAALDFDIPEWRGSLETAARDFKSFLKAGKISEKGPYKISLKKKNTGVFESYKIKISKTECVIASGDSEGARRALYFLQDQIKRSGGPFLTPGETKREPFIKNRISRCFFGPIKRPPVNRDELADDIDYYPEEYLNRLASESINGLWLTISFRDLCPSQYFPDQGGDSEKRLAKLRATVEKCARFGIKIYVFCIEPMGFGPNPEYLLDYAGMKRNPEFKGHEHKDWATYFCPSTDKARKYLEDSVFHIFSNVPGLGGLIDINLGERPTHCYSSQSNFFNSKCPRCSKRKVEDVFADVTGAMSKGMRRANPEAEMISWLYTPYIGPEGDKTPEDFFKAMAKIAAGSPKDVITQVNFESNGKVMQLGKERIALDYWLAWPGPSKCFEECAKSAAKAGRRFSAKIQTGCSHEVATIPFVPVPGNLFRKYQAMKRLGVSAVMQCWYFGNYPGLMNKAGGELSFLPFPETEDEFLVSMAESDWGRHAKTVSSAWRLFQEGYSQFPVNLPFTWYGPVHNSITWPLHIFPVDQPIEPSWKFTFPLISGDRIGECVCYGHTLDEVLKLLAGMEKSWSKGVKALERIEKYFKDSRERLLDIGLAKALGLQIKSARNVFRFYDFREKLPSLNKTARLKALAEMEKIVKEEIQSALRLKELCRFDSRLGFHSEAEGYKYFPEKLQFRAGLLEKLLKTDFPKLKKMILNDEPLFASYTGEKPEGIICLLSGGLAGAQTHELGNAGSFQAWTSGKNLVIKASLKTELQELRADFEPRRLWPVKKYFLRANGQSDSAIPGNPAKDTRWKAKLAADGKSAELVIPLESILDKPSAKRFRMNITAVFADNSEQSWVKTTPLPSRLTFGPDNPASLGWAIINE